MNKKILFVLPLCGLFVSCAPMDTTPDECVSFVYSGDCDGDKHFPLVTLNTNTLNISPKRVCAVRESTIEFRVVPPGKNDVGSVTVRAKDPLDTWLNGSNSPDEMKIEIFIPAWVEPEEDYDYAIYLSDGQCIDPRVRVQN